MYIDQVGSDASDFLAVCGFAFIGLVVSFRILLEYPAMPERVALL